MRFKLELIALLMRSAQSREGNSTQLCKNFVPPA
jgi:hypothetical protein